MKKILFIFLILLNFQPLSAQPKISLSTRKIIDFGKVSLMKSPYKKTVYIYNTGTDTLHVWHINTSCGCTTAPLDKKFIAPNDSAEMKISMTLTKPGKDEKSINIWSNDPNQKALTILVQAEVYVPIVVDPVKIILVDGISTGEVNKASFTLTNTTEDVIEIIDVERYPDGLKVGLPKKTKLKPNETIDIPVEFTAEKTGNYHGQIVIKTDYPDQDKFDIKIYAKVTD